MSENNNEQPVAVKNETDMAEIKPAQKKYLPKRSGKFSRLSVKAITYCALLMALGVVANTFTVYFNFAGSNALSFTYTVCFIAGAFFGPFAGFLVGAGGDFLGWIINPAGGAFNPFITLTSGLLGFLPGVVFMIARKVITDRKKLDKALPILVALSFVLTWLVCTNLNTVIFFYSYIYGKSTRFSALGAYYVYRIPFQTLFWAINLMCSLLLVYPIKKILKM